MLNPRFLPKTKQTAQSAPSRSGLTHLLILDFEATCQQHGRIPQQEIIEFPVLVYDLARNAVTATFHEYVRPAINPKLTDFCKGLTGIQQSTVDGADPFPDVWARCPEFLSSNGFTRGPPGGPSSNFAFMTCGDWDLKTMLPSQLALCQLAPDRRFRQRLNLKHEFAQCFPPAEKGRDGARGGRGMLYFLKTVGLALEGRHHSGIDDCNNIARVVSKMRESGWTPQLT